MFTIICVIAVIGVALLLNWLIGSVGLSFVSIFEKIGLGKTTSMIIGGCLFLVFLAVARYLINGYF